ncbi:MAG: thrombospondin type 3 repeat-containing protein [Deltaproteobacteria bacterium]|nr:thrombospondin type 3 repeat-containing protein [Deltaproteobacteria bacterium]
MLRAHVTALVLVLVAACDRDAVDPAPTPSGRPTIVALALGGPDDPYALTAPAGASRALAQDASHFYRVTVPASHDGLRVAVRATADVDVHVRRGASTGTSLRASWGAPLHTHFFAPLEVAADAEWYVEVHATTAASYDLAVDTTYAHTLAWDPGTSVAGSAPLSRPAGGFGDYLVRVTTQAGRWGAWRNVLRVVSGEADLALGPTPPTEQGGAYEEAEVGGDARVLSASEYTTNQTWYLRVRARTGDADWEVVSGDLFVHELGALGASSGGTLTTDVGGRAWFRTEVGGDALAWRLAAPGAHLYVNDTAAPIPTQPTSVDVHAPEQLLVVPGYLQAGGYLVCVEADDRDQASIVVDSRRHAVRTPSAEPTYTGLGEFSFTLSGDDDGGFGFVTYRVDVPVQQIAWQVSTLATSGHVDVYVRQGAVPADWDNDAMSEALGTRQSVALSPPTLTDGAWYVTVRGTPPFEFTLTSGNPTITTIPFLNDPPIQNAAPFTEQVGWRWFVVSDIESQTQHLGWILDLLDQAPGTTLALRKNRVPSRFAHRRRVDGNVYTGETSHFDDASTTGFLERPEHEADVWYIGVEQADVALGAFRLRTRALVATDLALNGGQVDVSAQPSGRWRWFKTTVPSDALGWDLRLDNVTSGAPRLVVRAERPPGQFGDSHYQLFRYGEWPTGAWWSPVNDLTRRPYRRVGEATVDETGRVFMAGVGGPLDPGVYYVGVSDVYTTPSGTPMSYRIRSRGIGAGAGWSLPVQTLAYDGGQAQVTALAPRDLRVYRVDVPAGAPSFAAELTPTLGDATLAIRQGHLPNIEAWAWGGSSSAYDHAGILRVKPGVEHYYHLPESGQASLAGGAYYLVVTGQGTVTADDGVIGTGTTSYTLRSIGQMPVLGSDTLVVDDGAPQVWSDVTLRYGELALHRFRVAEGLSSLEVRLTRDLGAPWFTVGQGATPSPVQSYYAAEGGAGWIANGDGVQTIQGPDGVYDVIVSALSTSQGVQVAARYDLEVVARSESVLAFDGGSAAVVDQETQTWRYFRVDVPADALGWDLRLVNIQGGAPRMVIRKADLPAAWYVDPSCCPDLHQRDVWEDGQTWPVDMDMSQRSWDWEGETTTWLAGTAVQIGVGGPLTPGSYYVGVSDSYTSALGEPMTYELVSRGIGLGAAWSIPVVDLGFADDADTVTLPARDVAWYRVVVPEGAASWELELDADALGGDGEAALAVRRGHLPNPYASGWIGPAEDFRHAGALRDKPGVEHFYLYPEQVASPIPSGVYYVAVASQGVLDELDYGSYLGAGSSTVTLTSRGEVEARVAASPLAPEAPITWSGEALRHGEQRVYRIEVPAGTPGLEVRLADVTGEPWFTLGAGATPSPTQSYPAAWGGAGYVGSSDDVLTIAEPAGTYDIVVAATHYGGEYVGASYELSVRVVADDILDFNGGSLAVDAQPTDTWRYFRVDVPAGALGWEVALEDVTSGDPTMVIQRDQQPTSAGTDPWCCPPLQERAEWQSGWQWAIGNDLTQRGYGPWDPELSEAPYEVGRRVQMGIGSPLEPGTYIIGVTHPAWSTAPLSYRVVSRGIGVGQDASGADWVIPVRDLPLSGSVETAPLAPREVAWYRLVVPQGTDSLGVELEALEGETMLAVRRGVLPNSEARIDHTADHDGSFAGTRRQKAGGEFFYAHPRPGLRTIEPDGPGVWYVAVAGEGRDPFSASNVGTGTSRARLTITSPVPVEGGVDRIVDAGEVRFDDQSLRYGERRLYRFRVAPDVPAFEVRLTNRVGAPRFAVDVGRHFDPAAPQDDAYPWYYRAADNGESAEGAADIAMTFVDRPGDVTVAVYSNGQVAEDVAFDLVVTPQRAKALAWDGGAEALAMKDAEVRFFRVEVPPDCDGVAQAGWIVRQEATAGELQIDIRKDELPGSPVGSTPTLTTSARESVIVPPFLEPGTWYVAVRASGTTQGTITTEEVRAARVWDMPARGESADTPGLVHPVFADTGVDDQGLAIENEGTEDQGVDLGEGRFRFYRVRVPADNRGYVRTRLVALSGDPELYIRRGAAPTLSHSVNYLYGSISDYRDTSDGTSYGHWVPNDARLGAELTPGDWWIGVYAEASSVRYRLVMDVGAVTDLPQATGAASSSLAAGDMHIYRVPVPATNVPVDWTLGLVQQSGDVVVLLREAIPAGFSEYLPDLSYPDPWLVDWGHEREPWAYDLSTMPRLEETGDLTLSLPLVRPGTDYFVCVFARSTATYDLTSSIGSERLALDGVLDWRTGVLDLSLPAGASRTYRIDVPADAGRWRHTADTGADGVWLYLGQGLIPPRNAYAHWHNNGQAWEVYNDLDRVLLDPGPPVGNFPFVAGESYYLVLENTTGSPQTVSLSLDGRAWDDDDDLDGLPDGWESEHFGQTGAYAEADSDGDTLTELVEYGLGTNPRAVDTDGDALQDGDELIAGANPLVPDTDLDAVCDGADSAPNDASEAGPVIRLFMGEMDAGAYGHGHGTDEHRTRLVAVFDPSWDVKAYWLHVTSWGVQAADEVEVTLNGVSIGHLPVGGGAAYAIPRMFWIPPEAVRAGTNRVELRQQTSGEPWGVKELGLFSFGERFGHDATRAYDVRHPDGLDFVVPPIGDVLLELAAFDLERADDVVMTLDGRPFLPAVPGSGDLTWSPRWQVPVLAAETEAGGLVLAIRPRAGADGDFQIRWVACRPLLTTFGTEGQAGEDDHAQAALGFLLPEATQTRELVVDWRVSDGERMALAGSLEEPVELDASDPWTWTDEVSLAPPGRDGPATVTWRRVPGEVAPEYPTFVVAVRYYGPCTDWDLDGVDDCDTGCAPDDADCDGVPDAIDCGPTDGSVTTTNEGDQDCDGVDDATDCGPTDPTNTTTNVGDQDCDGVDDASDCGPTDPTNTTTNVGDQDCDGVGDASDCGPTDPTNTTTNVGDQDCDGVGDTIDCAPTNAAVTTTNVGDQDCDGVADAIDCAPTNAAVTTTNVGDQDCDGVGDTIDCAPTNASVTTTNVGDADCDGVGDTIDCAPSNASVTTTNVGDQDCDGVPDADDCGAADPAITTSRALDGDCDGVPKDRDCDDADAAVGSRDGDLDCDGVPALVDCDDTDPSAGTSVGDADCDEVPTADDCDDLDPRIGARTLDQDCDGVAAGIDCDDQDPAVSTSCVGCVDADGDERYAIGGGCAHGDDCDDDDEDSTTADVDADCDGSLDEEDCDAGDPTIVGPCPEACADDDDDGAFGLTAECPQGRDCDDDDAASTTFDVDADCDGVPDATDVCPGVVDDQADADADGVGDACDVCPSEPDPRQDDADDDGVGDACEDGDGDGVPDVVDNCPRVDNPDQADDDGDGAGDACDATEILTEADDGCASGGVVLGWAMALVALVAALGLVGRRRRAA